MKIEEWLLAGEYVLAHENPNLMFRERDIRTFETYTRNTLDLSAIPIIKRESHCPIVIDPSQGAGRADLVFDLFPQRHSGRRRAYLSHGSINSTHLTRLRPVPSTTS
jgi:DAHP synthetase I family